MHVQIDIENMIRYSSVYELRELSEALAMAYAKDKSRAESIDIMDGESAVAFARRMHEDNPEWTLSECKRVYDIKKEISQ